MKFIEQYCNRESWWWTSFRSDFTRRRRWWRRRVRKCQTYYATAASVLCGVMFDAWRPLLPPHLVCGGVVPSSGKVTSKTCAPPTFSILVLPFERTTKKMKALSPVSGCSRAGRGPASPCRYRSGRCCLCLRGTASWAILAPRSALWRRIRGPCCNKCICVIQGYL